MHKGNLYTVPNLLTFYRFLSAPAIIWFIVTGRQMLFVIFIIINLVTDALDGFFARRLKQHTDLGAQLDSVADKITYGLALAGLLVFKREELMPHLPSLLSFFGLGVICLLHAAFKFGKISSLHTYATKIGGYMQGIFFFVLFAYDFIPVLYYIMIGWAILSVVEMIIIQLIITEMKPNVKGLYWVMKESRRGQHSVL